MKIFSIVFLLAATVSAQYKLNDYDLIKTTFLREFDRDIITMYLESDDEYKIAAALLSIAQSQDTTYVPQIINLDFEKNYKAIAFTLGKLGKCKLSAEYLTNQLRKSNEAFSTDIFEAIGKVGDKKDLSSCISIYEETNLTGFPLAIYNFRTRNIIDTSEIDIQHLLKLLNSTENQANIFQSLFTLYRVAPEKVNPVDLKIILENEYIPEIKLYAIGILRKNSSFPYSYELVKRLITDKDWSVRCEAARSVCFYNFQSSEEVFSYLNLLFDLNPNVSLTAAQSIKHLQISDENLKRSLKEFLSNLVFDKNLSENTRGELFLAIQDLYKESSIEYYRKYSDHITPINIYRYLGAIANYEFAFDELSRFYVAADDYSKFFIYSNMLNHFDSLRHNEQFYNFVLEQYLSDHPLNITLNNFEIDSTFAETHSGTLRENISLLLKNKIENTKFNQAISTLSNVTYHFDTNLTKSIITNISNSTNYELQYDLRSEVNISPIVRESREELLDSLFNHSFEYSGALIVTNKGNFTIEFSPSVAPISVGNFVSLAKKNFYNGVIFHRVVPNFVIQTGDPSGTGWSGPAHTIVSEFSDEPFDTYYVGMASSGKDTEGSQWFVMQNHYPHLNGNYTNFGKVINGLEVIERIDQYDVVKKIELIK